MEADWEVELGGDAPVIDGAWAGRLNLRLSPERIAELEEVAAFPPLGPALLQLNRAASPVWTAKCDFWAELEPGSWDPDEMDADPDAAQHGIGCYIDLLPNTAAEWAALQDLEQCCRGLCRSLHQRLLPGCRIDLIARQAWTTSQQTTHGITAYLTACGSDQASAQARLAACLQHFAEAVLALPAAIPFKGNSTVQ